MRPDYILTLSCPDRTGIVYRVSGLLFEAGCNILDAQQFGDAAGRQKRCVLVAEARDRYFKDRGGHPPILLAQFDIRQSK